MAENEELDLRLPGARRWFEVSRCVRNRGSAQQIAAISTPVLRQAVRKALQQLSKLGVSPEALYAANNDPKIWRDLSIRAAGHPYFRLMQDVLRAAPESTLREFHFRWMGAVHDKVADQIAVRESSSKSGTNFFEVRGRMQDAREIMAPGIEDMAKKRDENPDWKPTRQSTGEPPQSQVLSRSLLS